MCFMSIAITRGHSHSLTHSFNQIEPITIVYFKKIREIHFKRGNKKYSVVLTMKFSDMYDEILFCQILLKKFHGIYASIWNHFHAISYEKTHEIIVHCSIHVYLRPAFLWNNFRSNKFVGQFERSFCLSFLAEKKNKDFRD